MLFDKYLENMRKLFFGLTKALVYRGNNELKKIPTEKTSKFGPKTKCFMKKKCKICKNILFFWTFFLLKM